MKWKKDIIIFIGLFSIIVSSTFILANYSFKYNETRNNYLLDENIPGIVKGTAKIVDTEAYFAKHELTNSLIKLDLACNNSNNMKISLGYKSPSEALTIANNPIKEVVIWNGQNNFPEQSTNYDSQRNSKISNDKISMEWDLLAIGFNTNEFIKADERIWYLRIKDTSGGPYGYEKNVTAEVDGVIYTMQEYYPNIHHINEFKLIYSELIFETLLYPFFDGSKEIVIPIRGVQHELAVEDSETNTEIYGMALKSYTTTIPGIGSSNLWAIVFGTSNYLTQSGLGNLLYPPMECRSFILGCARSNAPDVFKDGIFDYGWRVAYSMDGDTDQTDIATCTQTDDNYLEDMFNFVNGKLGLTGKLMVFVANHGIKYYGYHLSITGKSRCWLVGWTNVIRLSEYETKIEAITDGGTHVLLWSSACHGDGLDSFSSSDHNNCLESWSFRTLHEGTPSNGNAPTDDYNSFCWLYCDDSGTIRARSECAFFFLGAAEGSCAVSVTDIGEDAQTYYNNHFDSTMYIQSTWSSAYNFYINWGY